MNVDKMLEQYSSVEELKIFVSSQMKQIQSLTKKNKELEEKLKGLPVPSASSLPPLAVSPEDAKTIAEVQLNMLKSYAFTRELTTDEAKRVELYNRILVGDAELSKKPKKADVEIINNADLLKLVE